MVLKNYSFILITTLAFIISCKEDEKLTVEDTKAISEESVTDSYFHDLDDISGVILKTPSDQEYGGGRYGSIVSVQDYRFDCYGITITLQRDTDSTPDRPKGVIIIDFGQSGCTDARGNTRTGKIYFAYVGKRFLDGAKVITTLENYTINGIRLEGVRTATALPASSWEEPKFQVILKDGRATFPDNSIAERESNIKWTWIKATSAAEDLFLVDKLQ